MKCPQCKVSMLVVERNQVELDFCYNCRGIWFDGDELELLLNDVLGSETHALLGELTSRPPLASTEKVFKCPICRKAMQKVDIGKCGRLIVDACISGHGLWFESGEVGSLIDQLGITADSELSGQDHLLFFVADTFKGQSEAGKK